jgi:hypothetical protein
MPSNVVVVVVVGKATPTVTSAHVPHNTGQPACNAAPTKASSHTDASACTPQLFGSGTPLHVPTDVVVVGAVEADELDVEVVVKVVLVKVAVVKVEVAVKVVLDTVTVVKVEVVVKVVLVKVEVVAVNVLEVVVRVVLVLVVVVDEHPNPHITGQCACANS